MFLNEASTTALLNAPVHAPAGTSRLNSSPRSSAMISANLMNEQLARSRHAELLSEAERDRLARRMLARQRLRRKALRAEQAALRARLALAAL